MVTNAEVLVIGQTAEMFPAPVPEPEEPEPLPPPAPPRKKVARLVVAQDVLAAIGLVTGIALAAVSLWAILKKYQKPAAPTSGQR